MKYASKSEFYAATTQAWDSLWLGVSQFPLHELETRVTTKPGAEPRSAKDTLAHVYAWHQLLLGWLKCGPDGNPGLPAPGFKWSETRQLNAELHDKYADLPVASVRRRLRLSHGRVLKAVDGLSETALLEAGHFGWTGKLPLMSYIAPNTASHYRWARKKLVAIQRALDVA